MQGTEDTVTNQINPVFVLLELSLLRKKDKEPVTPGVIAELCAIKKELQLTEELLVKTNNPGTHISQRKGRNSYLLNPSMSF